ncbi:MAG: hypothetical protein AAB263_04730 [Planctomycetota bacterium]
MKYILTIILLALGVGYGLYALMGVGVSQIEKTTQIQKKAETRLRIIQSVTGSGPSETAEEVTEEPILPVTATTVGAVKSYDISKGMTVSAVVLQLGKPPATTVVANMKILNYKSCNIVTQDNVVIGWSCK